MASTRTPALPMAARRRIAMAAFGFWALLLVAFVGTTAFTEMRSTDAASDVVKQVLVVAICTLLLLGTHARGQWRRTAAVPASLAVVLAFCLLTVSWSIAPDIAIRRLVLTAAVIWAIFRAVRELGPGRTLTIMRNAIVLVTILSWLAVMFTDFGVHGHEIGDNLALTGDWRGMFPHKNLAGEFFGFAILFLVFDNTGMARLPRLATLAAAGVFLLMTASKTSMGLLVPAILGGYAIRPYTARHRSLVWLAVAGAGVLALPLASLVWGQFLATLNDPDAFTSRSQIWALLLDYGGRNLWTGAGFGSFWQIGPDSPILMMTNDWVALLNGHGHNGYLDLLVTIGLPGLVLVILATFVWPGMLMLFDTTLPGQQRALYAAAMIFMLGDNMTETSLFDRIAIPQVMLTVCLALIHRYAAASPGEHQAIRRGLRSMLRRGVGGMRTGVPVLGGRRGAGTLFRIQRRGR